MAKSEPVISVKNLTTGYGNRVVVKNINADFFAGELVGIIGCNGAGKQVIEIAGDLVGAGAIAVGDDDFTRAGLQQAVDDGARSAARAKRQRRPGVGPPIGGRGA